MLDRSCSRNAERERETDRQTDKEREIYHSEEEMEYGRDREER